jgi:membrane-associated PAP2 superfamily phosphatase
MTLFDFLSGAITLGFLVAALFFLRFWRKTRDGLFLAFAMSFALLGIGQGVQALANIPQEERSYIYLIRLAAFTLILIAIFRKNRASGRAG